MDETIVSKSIAFAKTMHSLNVDTRFDNLGRVNYGDNTRQEKHMSSTEEFIINTNPALQALVDEVADTYREAGRVFGVSHTHIWHALNGTRKPISVNLLAKYAQRCRSTVGVSMQLLITADGTLKYKIEKQ
jgi:hypothetical protein|tara:strand:+ start:878 stop:1270 length:393 start_codon:yes stop_codon:yes gene_type:complete